MLKSIDHIQTCAHLTDEVTPLEAENYKRVREAASEAIVLLDKTRVPLKPAATMRCSMAAAVTRSYSPGSRRKPNEQLRGSRLLV